MPEILVAPTAGFCFGVRRAVERVETVARQSQGRRVVTLGPLLHNPAEVERLRRDLGVAPVSLDEVREDDLVVIRSHGIPVEDAREIEAGAPQGRVHDATCPYVRSCQELAARMAAAGFGVVLVGESGHPEVLSVVSRARAARVGSGLVAVVAGPEEAGALDLGGARRVAVLGQTTLPLETFRSAVAALVGRCIELRVLDTLCEATTRRQEESARLARIVDAVVVVGGRSSANTRHLVALCAAIQPRTIHIESASEIDPASLSGAARIGVTAGASTPASEIERVVRRLEAL
jgi:4-hydroxy-3-methylbut-2-en-1-yl diphosphate reductase